MNWNMYIPVNSFVCLLRLFEIIKEYLSMIECDEYKILKIVSGAMVTLPPEVVGVLADKLNKDIRLIYNGVSVSEGVDRIFLSVW